jgi:isopentenyldiphosphate isomerase
MDELIDILDAKGNPTGTTELKSYAHRMGLFHAAVHIWFYTVDGKVLLQQRGKDKDTHPLLWDVSVAGHIGAGEAIELSAIREVKEEILEKIGVFKSIQKHYEDLVDCEFHHTFLCELKESIEQLTKQEIEVESLQLISLHEFSKELFSSDTCGKYVPHSKDYYKTIIGAIKQKL